MKARGREGLHVCVWVGVCVCVWVWVWGVGVCGCVGERERERERERHKGIVMKLSGYQDEQCEKLIYLHLRTM